MGGWGGVGSLDFSEILTSKKGLWLWLYLTLQKSWGGGLSLPSPGSDAYAKILSWYALYRALCFFIDIYFKVRMSLFTVTDVEESPNPNACPLCGWSDHGPKQLGRGLPGGTAARPVVWTCFRWRKEDAVRPLPLTVPLSVSGLYLLRIRKVCKNSNLYSHICIKLQVIRMHLYIVCLFHCS